LVGKLGKISIPHSKYTIKNYIHKKMSKNATNYWRARGIFKKLSLTTIEYCNQRGVKWAHFHHIILVKIYSTCMYKFNPRM